MVAMARTLIKIHPKRAENEKKSWKKPAKKLSPGPVL
jgi:hypothetical protein